LQPTKLDLVINHQTARLLGIAVPEHDEPIAVVPDQLGAKIYCEMN